MFKTSLLGSCQRIFRNRLRLRLGLRLGLRSIHINHNIINKSSYQFSDQKDKDNENKDKDNDKDNDKNNEQNKENKNNEQNEQDKENKNKKKKTQQIDKDYLIDQFKNFSQQLSQTFDLNKLWNDLNRRQQEINKQTKVFIFLIGLFGLQYIYNNYLSNDYITINDFMYNYLEKNLVKQIKIFKLNQLQKMNEAEIEMLNGDLKYVKISDLDFFICKVQQIQKENQQELQNMVAISFGNFFNIRYYKDRLIDNSFLLLQVVSLYVLIGVRNQSMSMMNRQSPGVDKKFEMQKNIMVKFKDVAGMKESKLEITEFVDFLQNPSKYQKLGARMPRGALLSGPPGTGKTLLAKACAGQAGVPFFYLSGSEFVEMFVGVGASRVRQLFKQAKENSPAIIFIDEIDAIGKKREQQVVRNDEADNTLNQLLVEMDGFSTNQYVVVMGATNRPELLDNALTRPGRFDRNIEVTLPDLEGRTEIFIVHLKPLKLDEVYNMEEYARRLATLTPGFSGAEIHNLCNEAAILAARNNQTKVTAYNFEMAAERIIGGLEKKSMVNQSDRQIVAVHESGHAICGWFLQGCQPLLKLTIIPRTKGSLGFAQYLPKETNLYFKQELMDQLCFIYGGRCAEELFFGKVTTGASDDIQRAYDLAYNMVTKYGMSDQMGYRHFEEGGIVKHYSQQTQGQIDQAIDYLVIQAQNRARQLVLERKSDIERLSHKLLEKETLDLNDIVKVLGERPFEVSENFQQYLQVKNTM